MTTLTQDEKKFWNILLSFVQDEKAEAYIQNHFQRYLKTIELIPVRGPLAALDVGTFIPFAALLQKTTPHRYKWHDHWEGDLQRDISVNGETFHLFNFDVERDTFPFEDGSFDLVLCNEVIEHLGIDPFHMLSEINRVLRRGGQLILSTPNIASTRGAAKMLLGYSPYLYASFTLNGNRHNREYCLSEIMNMMDQSGFKVDRSETGDVYFKDEKMGPRFRLLTWILDALRTILGSRYRGDTIFVVARKTGAMATRYPPQFYDIEGSR
jgi:SAM-dependent methyltransferase